MTRHTHTHYLRRAVDSHQIEIYIPCYFHCCCQELAVPVFFALNLVSAAAAVAAATAGCATAAAALVSVCAFLSIDDCLKAVLSTDLNWLPTVSSVRKTATTQMVRLYSVPMVLSSRQPGKSSQFSAPTSVPPALKCAGNC